MNDLSHMTTPDTRPGPYYVSAIDGPKVHTMAGPYAEHAAALADVDKARNIAYSHDGRAWFMPGERCASKAATAWAPSTSTG